MAQLDKLLVNGLKLLLQLATDDVDTGAVLAALGIDRQPTATQHRDATRHDSGAVCSLEEDRVSSYNAHRNTFEAGAFPGPLLDQAIRKGRQSHDLSAQRHLDEDEDDNIAKSSNQTPEIDSSREYPNGNVCYWADVTDRKDVLLYRRIGWAAVTYSTSSGNRTARKRHVKSCLGVYVCPRERCGYVERPKVPRRNRNKHCLPMKSEALCVHHQEPLLHLPCEATITIEEHERQSTTVVIVSNHGVHRHPRPPPIRPSAEAYAAFKQMVNFAPG